MRFLRAIIIGLLLATLTSCAITLGTMRWIPRYDGVDPEMISYVNEYLTLAKEHNIKFDDRVTVGFRDIHDGNAIGETIYAVGFREIDVDRNYWKNATKLTRMSLLFHELGHAYCGRDHNTSYRKEDSCPASLMFPTIMSDACLMFHYQDYVEDLFKNCDPY